MFSTRFWSTGYQDGIETLFAKLNQGIQENNELIALAQARSEAEDAHGKKLQSLACSLSPKKNGFGRDDGATMRKAYEGIVNQLAEEGRQHTHIAESIKKMVIDPFSLWANQHKNRIDNSHQELRRLVKSYSHELDAVRRAQQRYFNRCRMEEDNLNKEGGNGDGSQVDENGKVSNMRHSSDGDDSSAGRRPRLASTSSADVSSRRSFTLTEQVGSLTVDSESSTSEELVLAGRHYSASASQKLVARMLAEIPQHPTKVPILGVYEHTSTGSAISEWIRQNTDADTIEQVEEAGQDLVNYGLLRLIGQVGSRFVNSSVFSYQWRPRAWEFAGLSMASVDAASASSSAQLFYQDLAKRWTARTDPATQSVRELDQKYRKAVDILSDARTDLEATMFEHLDYLERCERERLAAFKAVLLDFAAAISNVVPALSASVDQMLLYHETADVERDLRFLVENYQTGRYNPEVVVYDNYYSSVDGAAVFGLDLDLRARADKKRVPIIVSTALSTMDSAYPPMENDKARLNIWQVPVYTDFRQSQEARQAINDAATSPNQIREIFSKLAPLTVVQTLKLYFLELPTSLINGQLYDILKSIYAKFGTDSEEDSEARIHSLQNTLAQLTLSHIATLDALTSHIHRLITIANAVEDDVDRIAKEWGPILCRPKVRNATSLDDVFPVRLFKDILASRDRIFGELKKQAMLSPQSSVTSSNSKFRSVSQRSRIVSSKQHSRFQSPSSSSGSPSSSQQSLTHVAPEQQQQQQQPSSRPSSLVENDRAGIESDGYSDAPEGR